GLRPARYVITRDRHITLASEIGVYDYDQSEVLTKGRLKPGQMIAADTATGRLLLSDDIDNMLKSRQPYKQWLREHAKRLEGDEGMQVLTSEPLEPDLLRTYEKMFNVTFEERDQVLRVLAESGQEAVGSMGDDTPFAVLSRQV